MDVQGLLPGAQTGRTEGHILRHNASESHQDLFIPVYKAGYDALPAFYTNRYYT